jgi:sRNA-binding regulator protein Hfq
MKTNEGNLTLRQRFEQNRESTSTKSESIPSADIFLRKLIGHSVTVKFQGGDEVTGVLAAIDRFTIKLGADLVVFKHAVQSLRMTGPQTRGS